MTRPARFVLIHGAGEGGWAWHLVADALRGRGHDVAAPDLPAGDESAGLSTYADAVVDRIGGRGEVVVVGHSFACFTAPLVSARVPTKLLVLLAPMIPSPGESADEWWGSTGHGAEVRVPDDVFDAYYHDVPRRSRSRRSGGSATIPRRPRAANRGRSTRGRRCPRGSCSRATTGCSRRRSCSGSPGSDWGSRPTRSTVGIASPSATPGSWRTASSPTWFLSHPEAASPRAASTRSDRRSVLPFRATAVLPRDPRLHPPRRRAQLVLIPVEDQSEVEPPADDRSVAVGDPRILLSRLSRNDELSRTQVPVPREIQGGSRSSRRLGHEVGARSRCDGGCRRVVGVPLLSPSRPSAAAHAAL